MAEGANARATLQQHRRSLGQGPPKERIVGPRPVKAKLEVGLFVGVRLGRSGRSAGRMSSRRRPLTMAVLAVLARRGL